VPWTAPSISCEDVAAGLLGADALYQASLEEGPEQVESALLGDGQRIPNLARGETLLVAEQLEQLLLFGAQDQLPLFRFRGEFQYARPDTLQGEQQPFGTVVEPTGQVLALLAHGLEGGVVSGAVLPVEFVDGKDVVGIEATAVEFPEGQSATGAAISVREWVDGLETVMDDGRAEDWRQLSGFLVPPGQQLEHEAGHILGRWRGIAANPHVDGAVAAGWALVHNLRREDAMQGEHVVVAKKALAGVLLHETERGEVIDDFTPRTDRDGGQVAAFLHGAHLLKRERVALDGSGGMGVAGAGVLLERGNPLDLDGGSKDPFPQGGDLFDSGEERRRDSKLRLEAHRQKYQLVKYGSSYW
jgi:hypothetical protein